MGATITYAGILAIGVITLPCWICSLCTLLEMMTNPNRQNPDNDGNMSQAVISNLMKTQFNPEVFKQMSECAICTVEFTNDDEITPLPCNTNHYFHTECIEQWMKQKTECPMCRAKIDLEALNLQRETMK